MCLEDKLRIKELGPDQPALRTSQQITTKGKTYTRHFTSAWYQKKSWLCGCPVRNAVFCFPCILFGGGHSQSDFAWTVKGMTDLKHFSERVKKHEIGKAHIKASLKLSMLGRANIAKQLDHDYHAGILRHNLQVDHNRQTLSKLIDCVKFCGAFELALRGQDETESLENPGVFRGLVDFVSKLDVAMKEHLEKATVFKGSAKAIQNELLDCMQDVMQGHIIQDLQNAQFVSLQADETTDVSTHCQLVVVYRYIDACSAVQERFFSLFKMEEGATADAIGNALLENLGLIFPPDADKAKLVSQTYDGASVMRGVTGDVRKMIQDVYPNAHFLHCYAHPLNLVMQKAASAVPQARVFFSDLSGFTSFFSRSPKRTKVFDDTVARRRPHAPQTPCNFHFRLVNTVHEHVDDLLECFQTIQYSSHFDEITIREAKGFIRMLEDNEFLFFLELFSGIMPCVNVLFAKLQLRSIDATKVQNATKVFTTVMAKIRESVPELCEKFTATQSRGGHDARRLQAYQVIQVWLSLCYSHPVIIGRRYATLNLIDTSFFLTRVNSPFSPRCVTSSPRTPRTASHSPSTSTPPGSCRATGSRSTPRASL